MKLSRLAVLALFAAAPAFAGATSFVVDFEKSWDYGVSVDGFYSGGKASDATTGDNLGVEFFGMMGLSNDGNFTYYSGAPSSDGIAQAIDTDANGAHTNSYMNVAAGVQNGLSLFYASYVDVSGAVKAYSGLNGTGDLLGTFKLDKTANAGFDSWKQVTLKFSGTAKSFDLTGSAGQGIGFDNFASVSAVPEASTSLMMLAGGFALLGLTRRRRG
ncbi:PEP-CTERM sorting domain-containing protein [Paucibacter sp. TC2R-5]|uniref:PEP-CTERM sorting domain-containing protein n=1 Tax=Paucibacter sp. TC2R-5 TaxID=2893555 RepID=UPI0021E379CE|nr:PEP-CTERM sorting domain-containing protein [Paucibacter sp. TC2R-5]MCV2359858.1 PEP-CTERM sorting domain-containing protein [Paucibacter sp. TC2R-5]